MTSGLTLEAQFSQRTSKLTTLMMTPKETMVCNWPRLRANVKQMPRVTVVATVATTAAMEVDVVTEVAMEVDVVTEVAMATEAGAVVPALRTIVAVSKGAVASCRPT